MNTTILAAIAMLAAGTAFVHAETQVRRPPSVLIAADLRAQADNEPVRGLAPTARPDAAATVASPGNAGQAPNW